LDLEMESATRASPGPVRSLASCQGLRAFKPACNGEVYTYTLAGWSATRRGGRRFPTSEWRIIAPVLIGSVGQPHGSRLVPATERQALATGLRL
jgi:hypothetical protein